MTLERRVVKLEIARRARQCAASSEKGYEPVCIPPVAITPQKSSRITPAFVGLAARPRVSILPATTHAFEGRASGTKLERRRGVSAPSWSHGVGRRSRADGSLPKRRRRRTRHDSPRCAAVYRTRPIPSSSAPSPTKAGGNFANTLKGSQGAAHDRATTNSRSKTGHDKTGIIATGQVRHKTSSPVPGFHQVYIFTQNARGTSDNQITRCSCSVRRDSLRVPRRHSRKASPTSRVRRSPQVGRAHDGQTSRALHAISHRSLS
jgi:hypothetical protein